jgi:hypothetical protein
LSTKKIRNLQPNFNQMRRPERSEGPERSLAESKDLASMTTRIRTKPTVPTAKNPKFLNFFNPLTSNTLQQIGREVKPEFSHQTRKSSQ